MKRSTRGSLPGPAVGSVARATTGGGPSLVGLSGMAGGLPSPPRIRPSLLQSGAGMGGVVGIGLGSGFVGGVAGAVSGGGATFTVSGEGMAMGGSFLAGGVAGAAGAAGGVSGMVGAAGGDAGGALGGVGRAVTGGSTAG